MLAAEALAAGSPTRTYDREFYRTFQPRTALDMLERTPGFSLDVGAEIRGFSGAAGNVLIDGARPAAKGEGVYEALSRLPATAVASIELLDGAEAPGARGHATLANIRLRKDAAASGSWTLLAERAPGGVVFPNASVSYARSGPVWRTDGSLSGAWERHPSSGGYLYEEAGGARLRAIERRVGNEHELAGSGSASRGLAGGELTLSGRVEWERYVEALQRTQPTAPEAWRQLNKDGSDTYVLELGADWSGPLSERWSGRATLLASGARVASRQSAVEGDARTTTTASSSRQHSTRSEAVANLALTTRDLAPVTLEVGGEIALNRASSRLDYVVDDGSGPLAVDLPASDVDVREWRGEAFAHATRALGRRLILEARLALEASWLSVHGDARASEQFNYLKPSAALTYTTGGGAVVKLGLRRVVGQLAFESFAASVSTEEGRDLAGNPRLKPDSAWRLELNFDRKIGESGAFSVQMFHDWRRDVLEYLVLPSGEEGLGNVRAARAWGLSATTTIPLDRLVAGGELKASAELVDSRIIDPVTRRPRRLNDSKPAGYSLEFRQDLADLKLAWGVGYDSASTTRSVYTGEIMDLREARVWRAFAETTAWRPYKLELSLYGLDADRSSTLRQIYEPDRSGELSARETLRSRSGTYLLVTLSQSF